MTNFIIKRFIKDHEEYGTWFGKEDKHIKVISCPENILQAKKAGELLNEIIEEEKKKENNLLCAVLVKQSSLVTLLVTQNFVTPPTVPAFVLSRLLSIEFTVILMANKRKTFPLSIVPLGANSAK